MICLETVKKYCKNYTEIENYAKAVADTSEMWECHHRFETKCPVYHPTIQDLKDWGLYYNRPASELIFLTAGEHKSLHKKGNTIWKGRHHTEEARQKMSDAQAKRYIRCIETGEVHYNREWLKLGYYNTYYVASGRRKTCKGLHFTFVD